MDVPALIRYARVRRNDIVAALVAAVGVLLLGPLNGLLLAVAGSVLGLVFRSTRVDVEVMGRVPDEKAAWGGTRNHPERSTYPEVLVLRIDVPIFWVTAAPVTDSVLAKVAAAPGTRAVVLDLEATNQMDTTSADALAGLRATLDRKGIDLYLVRVMWPVREALRRSGLVADLGEDHLWHSISQGVRQARHVHGLLEPRSLPGELTEEPLGADDDERIAAHQPGPDPAGPAPAPS